MLSHGEEITGKIWKVAKVYLTDNPVTLKTFKKVIYSLIQVNLPNGNTM